MLDRAAEVVLQAQARAAAGAGHSDAFERMRAGTLAFLTALSEHPEYAQTLLVEIIGAGPRATQRTTVGNSPPVAIWNARKACSASVPCCCPSRASPSPM